MRLPCDLDEWKQTLLSLPEKCQDIYFHPEYLSLNSSKNKKRQVFCVKYQQADRLWILPVVLNPIEKIGNIDLQEGLFDLETAYGYGGPLTNCEDQNFISNATQAFISWANTKGVVAQFIRFHPLLANERWIDHNQLEVLFDRFTVSTNILKIDEPNKVYSKSARNSIKRGLRLGIETKLVDVDYGFSVFVQLYQSTMDQLDADPYYYFDQSYFEKLKCLVINNGCIIASYFKGQMISAAIFIYGSCWMHYHLSGSNFEKRLPGSTNIILDLAIREAKSKGLKQLHLGGGTTQDSDDSLLYFKKSMSTDLNKFFIGKRIFQQDVYSDLIEIWKEEFPSLVDTYGHRILCYRYSDS